MEISTETSSDESAIGRKPKSFSCTFPDCKAAFSKNRKLVNHIRRHTGERPFTCDEPNCDKTYTNSSHLRRHKKVFHEKCSEHISCDVVGCHRELANKWCLKKHYNRFHNPERQYPFTCNICKQGFHRKRQLQQHSYLHSGELSVSCDECNAKFITTRDCNRHKRTHTKYPCECGEIFERWTSLLLHRKNCGRKEINCSVCDKTFSSVRYLNSHLKTHENKEDRDVFMCPYENCVRYYFHQKNLAHHVNVFHKRMPRPKIPCKYSDCKKLFSKMQNYKQHLLRHLKPTERKTERKPRKDKGCFRKSVLSKLCGLSLPLEVEGNIISGQEGNLNLKLAASLSRDNVEAVNVSQIDKTTNEVNVIS